MDPYRMGSAAVPGTLRGTFRDGACDPLPARLPRSRTDQARATTSAAKKAAGLIQRRLIVLAFGAAGDVVRRTRSRLSIGISLSRPWPFKRRSYSESNLQPRR